jgi:hypothetical protein
MGEKKTRTFIKRPVIVEAFQFGYEEEPSWFRPAVIEMDYDNRISRLKGCISTLGGDIWFWEGDYVIRGVKGELYPCRRDIFEETYEEVLS